MKVNKKTLIPSIGTLIILSSLIIYFIISAIGLIQNPFFDPNPAGKNTEVNSVSLEDINKNAPQKSWNSQAPELSAEQISQTINTNISILQQLSPFVSIVVKDAITGKTLYALNEKIAKTVASSTKLLSMIASIEQLGQDYEFTTKTLLADKNNLYLFSNGDVLLNIQDSNPNNTLGFAGLKTLAEKTAQYLKQYKVNTITLNIDDTYFGDQKTLNSWYEQGTQNSIGKVTPISIVDKLVGNNFIQEPEKIVSETFSTHLRNFGIQVNTINQHKKTPKKAKFISEVKSDKLKNIVKHTLKESDNTTAEVISRAAAINAGYEPTFKDTARFVKNTLKKLEVDTHGLYLEDASGLSKNNKITTTTLTSALEKTFINNPRLFEVYNSLPISGTDGTLKQRMTNITGKVMAKTGTLPQTSSLTGVIFTNSGRTLNFSINSADFNEKTFWNIRQNIDILVEMLQKQ